KTPTALGQSRHWRVERTRVARNSVSSLLLAGSKQNKYRDHEGCAMRRTDLPLNKCAILCLASAFLSGNTILADPPRDILGLNIVSQKDHKISIRHISYANSNHDFKITLVDPHRYKNPDKKSF